jgi:NADH:ubiquinone oxidoreductase subunit D
MKMEVNSLSKLGPTHPATHGIFSKIFYLWMAGRIIEADQPLDTFIVHLEKLQKIDHFIKLRH